MLNFFSNPGSTMSAREAYEAARNGDIILIDIRTPGEWAKTGVPEGAKAISASDPNFLARLNEFTGGDQKKKIAVICATGGRSGQVSQALRQYGWENVIDVSEGVMGNMSAPGWARSGLPLVPYNG